MDPLEQAKLLQKSLKAFQNAEKRLESASNDEELLEAADEYEAARTLHQDQINRFKEANNSVIKRS